MAEDVILEQTEHSVNINTEETGAEVFQNSVSLPVSNEETPALEMDIGFTEVVGVVGDVASTTLNIEASHSQYLPNQHTISAITGLTETLTDIQELKDTLYAKKTNTANYYLWSDENPLQENRKGLFVCLNANNTISACTDTSEIFGVTVDAAALVGGQTEITRNYKYGLVACDGQVYVQCELNVVADDYVISNAYGIAKANNLNYGYKVISVVDIDGVKYATISLSSWEQQIVNLGENVDSLTTRMNTAESNIAGAIHVANSAINQAGDIGVINTEMNERVDQMEDTVEDMSASVEQMEVDVANAVASAIQARDIATSMHTSATTLANEAFAAASNVQTYAQSLVAKIDKYSVGEYSQANGLTLSQAASIMKNGMIYVPTVNHDEELPAHRSFTVGNSYLWTIDGWQEYDSSVYISSTYPGPANTITLWYTNTDEAITNDGITYEPYTLYEWQDGWVGVASQTGNAVARSVSLLTQTTNELSGIVTDARGSAVSLKAKLDDMGAQSAAVASLAIKTDGTVIGILSNTTAPVGAIVDDYYAVGSAPPYEVYRYNGAVLVKVPNTSSDGVNIHKVNVASIINSVNNDGDSSISLNADKINFTGFANFTNSLNDELGSSGTTTIDGARITTGEINTDRLNATGLINIINSEGSTTIDGGKITANSITAIKLSTDAIQSRNYMTNVSGTKLDLSNGVFDSVNFKIDENGNVTANNMNLTGGVISSSNYVANVSGTKLNLANGAFDSINFKIDDNGTVAAKNLYIDGDTLINGSLTVNGTLGGTLSLIAGISMGGNLSFNNGFGITFGGTTIRSWDDVVARFG